MRTKAYIFITAAILAWKSNTEMSHTDVNHAIRLCCAKNNRPLISFTSKTCVYLQESVYLLGISLFEQLWGKLLCRNWPQIAAAPCKALLTVNYLKYIHSAATLFGTHSWTILPHSHTTPLLSATAQLCADASPPTAPFPKRPLHMCTNACEFGFHSPVAACACWRCPGRAQAGSERRVKAAKTRCCRKTLQSASSSSADTQPMKATVFAHAQQTEKGGVRMRSLGLCLVL